MKPRHEYGAGPDAGTGQAPTRVRGRVCRLECAKEVLLGTKLEVTVLRGDRYFGLGRGVGELLGRRGAASLHGR